jgi:hypothetical protein
MLMLFLIWVIYLTLGMLWLVYIIKKKYIREYNLLGSLILLMTWPLHLFYKKNKK